VKVDLTEGHIGQRLIIYFLPIAAGTLFQQLYNAVDAIIVGKFVGTVALAAVGGSAANITNILVGFFMALSGGCTVVIAQLFGAKDQEKLRRATGTSIAFCIVAGIALTVIGILTTRPLLVWLKSPENTIADAETYLRIIYLGVIATLLYNIESGILRAVGDSRSPFIYLLICCVTNIVLDLVFVIYFRMGVAGVAIATVASQALSAGMATVKLLRSTEAYRIDLHRIKFDSPLLKEMLRIGIPTGLQAAMYSISNMVLQVAVNLLGTTAVAAWSLSGKIDGFYWACSSAAGVAVMNFSAQNYGAGKIDRVRAGQKLSTKLFIGITFVFSGLLLTLGRMALPLFTDDLAVIRDTETVMFYIVPCYFMWTSIEILSGVLRGVGDAVIPVVIDGIGICLLRAIWILTVYRASHTLEIICLSYGISWAITATAFILYYCKGHWQGRLSSR